MLHSLLTTILLPYWHSPQQLLCHRFSPFMNLVCCQLLHVFSNCHAMLCISAAYAVTVTQYMSVCLYVCPSQSCNAECLIGLTKKQISSDSSRKSWALICRLGAAQQPPKSTHPSVSANAIATHLVQVAKAPHDKKFECQVRMQGRTLLQQMSDKEFLIHSLKRRFQLLRRRQNQRQPQVTTTSMWNSWRTWTPKLAPGCPNSSPESWLPIPSQRSGEWPRW